MSQPNPYQPPEETAAQSASQLLRRSGFGLSVFMILAGLAFCVGSFYALVGHGIFAFWNVYQEPHRFPIWFLLFYGFVSGLTSLFHILYLTRGKPQQHLAGVYAIGCAVGLTCVAIAVLEMLAWR